MLSKVAQRIFIVGCARSGTTLVQAMLSSHPAVCGFPETFYFAHARVPKNYNGPSRWWGNKRQAIYSLQNALSRLQTPETVPLHLHLARPESIDNYFLSLLDRLALQAGKLAWSEKTPGHVHYLDRISEAQPDAVFVHVLRDGRDVVASLEDLHRKTPSDAKMPTWNLEESIEQWNQCLAIAQSHNTYAGHHHLHYSDLVSHPEKTLKKLCQFMALPFDQQMLNHQRASAQILGTDSQNAWRRDVLKPITDTHLIKYNELFTIEEQRRIEKLLVNQGSTRLS